MESEIYTFETIYKYARIDTSYKSEAEVIEDFMNDSVPLIVTSRKLTTGEEATLNAQQIIPKTTRIALDAVALIVNNNNPDSTFFYNSIKDIFTGKITRWDQINPESKLGEIRVIFDNYKSANPRYFKEKFGLDSLPPTCYAVQSNREVISFIEKNPEAIGVISVNWISDYRDSVSQNFLQRIRVAGISDKDVNEYPARFYQPYQYYVAEGRYPFIREVYCINRQTYSGLAFGITAFIACDKGQLIVLHSGLVPATMPIRIVEVK
jgi:phosphate transport system substrate-binding protein